MTTSSPLTDADRIGISGLTDSQWQMLRQVLEEQNHSSDETHSGKFFLESWIIDSGATNHMTITLEFLHDVCVKLWSQFLEIVSSIDDRCYNI